MFTARTILNKVLPSFVALPLRRWYVAREVLHGTAGYEDNELRMLPDFLVPGGCALDIGANAGLFTHRMSQIVGPQGKVYAFEPIPHNYQILEQVVRKAQLQNVKATRCAVGETDGEAGFMFPHYPGFGRYYLSRFAESNEKVALTVPMRSLDSLLRSDEMVVPQFIKCDVEGQSARIIRGAVELIRKHRPTWLVECWYDSEIELMIGLGYDAFAATTREKVIALLPPHRNYLFIHREAVQPSRQAELTPSGI